MAYDNKKTTATATPSLELDVTTKNFVQKIEGIASGIDLEFDDYQKQCVFNAIRTIDPMVKKEGYSLAQFDQDNVILVLQPYRDWETDRKSVV